jgi:hypothetical protein
MFQVNYVVKSTEKLCVWGVCSVNCTVLRRDCFARAPSRLQVAGVPRERATTNKPTLISGEKMHTHTKQNGRPTHVGRLRRCQSPMNVNV